MRWAINIFYVLGDQIDNTNYKPTVTCIRPNFKMATIKLVFFFLVLKYFQVFRPLNGYV